MLSSKVSTPIFAKSSSSRRIGEYQAGSGKARRNSGPAHKTLEEANLRIVQYEIAEREACKVIGSMCAEAATRLDIVDTEYEIDDILSGILVLGNLYKRVGNEKVTLEGTIEGMKNEYTTLESEKNFMIDRLETAILRLQMENNKLQENMTEMKLKHNHKLMIAMKEIHEHQEQSELLKSEKAQLETKLQYQERRLMEVPRMEEQYQRNARGIVRQQEVANTLKEIGWKKLEGEVKSMNFWKSKAKSLEETVSRQKGELDNLNAQGRLNLSRYQSLLLSYQTLKRSHPHDDFTMHNVMMSNRPGTAGTSRPSDGIAGDGEGKRSKRPGSAPAGRVPTNSSSSADLHNVHTGDAEHAATSALTDETLTAEAAKAAHDLHHGVAHAHDNTHGAHASLRRGTEHHKPRHNIFKKTLHHISAEELEKLRDIITAKDVIITKLSRKLSHARAYPLQGINVPDFDSGSEHEDYENVGNNGTQNLKHQTQHQHQRGNNTRSSAKYSTLSSAFAEEDNASESESFVAAEDAHQQRRVERAIEIQQLYNERSAKAKASNPPHIRAIREARSFAENVTKNVRRPQSAY